MKVYGPSIYKALEVIFNQCNKTGVFLSEWKNGNIVPTPTHCSSSSQSGFKPGNSCINQILSISYEIYSSFDGELEVRNVFLNISKAFCKMWQDGIIFKLTQHGVSEILLNFLRDVLN